jgi:hypothetical protein
MSQRGALLGRNPEIKACVSDVAKNRLAWG